MTDHDPRRAVQSCSRPIIIHVRSTHRSPRGGAEVYTFWINQDIRVPLDEFEALIKRAVTKMGKLNPHLAGLRTD